MGVVRREGNWRLEKREEGLYEITYQNDAQMKVLTPEYNAGMMDGPMLDTIPVREVGSYSEVEGLFEELAHGGPPDRIEPLTGGTTSIQNTSGEKVDFEGIDEDSFEDIDLPPGGIGLILLVIGGITLANAGLAPGSAVFMIGIVFTAGGVAIFGWAGVLFQTKGWREAYEFLATVDESLTNRETTDSDRTPPTPEKLKNTLIFDRAGQQCEWCEERFDHPHVHHIEPRREGGPNEPRNLIVLCPNCHEKADREAIPRSKLKAKVDRLPDVSME